MSGNTLTLVGNLTDTPELRQTSGGAAVANFTVAHTPRVFDKKAEEWVDGDTVFLRCAVWHAQAENFAESAVKGARVVVIGTVKANNWETDGGEKRTSLDLDVDEVGFSTRFATVEVTKKTGGSGNGGSKSKSSKSDDSAKSEKKDKKKKDKKKDDAGDDGDF